MPAVILHLLAKQKSQPLIQSKYDALALTTAFLTPIVGSHYERLSYKLRPSHVTDGSAVSAGYTC